MNYIDIRFIIFSFSLFTGYQIHQLEHHHLDRTIEFDDKNEEHVQYLKNLWKDVFPQEEWKGLVGDHWKLMGFQGKNPTTDLRSMGVMGLRVNRLCDTAF